MEGQGPVVLPPPSPESDGEWVVADVGLAPPSSLPPRTGLSGMARARSWYEARFQGWDYADTGTNTKAIFLDLLSLLSCPGGSSLRQQEECCKQRRRPAFVFFLAKDLLHTPSKHEHVYHSLHSRMCAPTDHEACTHSVAHLAPSFPKSFRLLTCSHCI